MTKHRRWRMLWLGLKQLPKEEQALWRNELGQQVYCVGYNHYDRCYELGISYELVVSRRRYRGNMVGVDKNGHILTAKEITNGCSKAGEK